MVKKARDDLLKLLPPLIRCLLIHGGYLPSKRSLINPGFRLTAAVAFYPGKEDRRLFHDQMIPLQFDLLWRDARLMIRRRGFRNPQKQSAQGLIAHRRPIQGMICDRNVEERERFPRHRFLPSNEIRV